MKLSLSQIRNGIRNFSRPFREASSSQQITNANLKNFIIKQVGWTTESDDYSPAENDLLEIKSAIETDSYVKVSLDKIFQLIFKAGYKMTGNNQAAIDYLKERIRIMEFGTNIPFDVLLRETGRDLVYYSNAFWVKSRIDKIQSSAQIKAVLEKKPVGGYFRLDPTSIEIKRDSNGAVTGYKVTGDNEKEFKAADVVHFYTDREASNNFGTPRAISSLEDVKILRKIEGNVLSLIYRFAIPLYQMKIGLPEPNFMATQKELDDAKENVEKMPLDGIIVTDERTAINAVGADGKAIEMDPYLGYFENRVFTGLNISQAMMGRGGNKQDADSMEGLMHDNVKHYQAAISVFIQNFVFNELLLEGGYNPIYNADDIVSFEFNEINLDTKVKLENHVLNKLQSNAITFEEARMALGYKNEQVDESRLYSNMITTKNAIDLINAKVSAENQTGNGNLSNGKSANSNPNGAVKSTATPSNQHGTTSAKIKESYDGIVFQELTSQRKAPRYNDSDISKEDREKLFSKDFPGLDKIYIEMKNEISQKNKLSKTVREKYEKRFNREMRSVLTAFSKEGIRTSQLPGNKISVETFKDIRLMDDILKLSDKQISGWLEDISSKLESKDRPAIDVVSYMFYRIRFISEYLTGKIYWASRISGYKSQGIKEVKLELSDNHSKDHDDIVSTGNFNIDQIPPFNPYCSCKVIEPENLTQNI